MELVEVMGKIAIGQSSKREAIEWAMEQVERGMSGTHLYLLAGMNESDTREEVLANLVRAVDEIGVEFLYERQAIDATENFSLVEGLTLENYPEFIRGEARDFIEEMTKSNG